MQLILVTLYLTFMLKIKNWASRTRWKLMRSTGPVRKTTLIGLKSLTTSLPMSVLPLVTQTLTFIQKSKGVPLQRKLTEELMRLRLRSSVKSLQWDLRLTMRVPICQRMLTWPKLKDLSTKWLSLTWVESSKKSTNKLLNVVFLSQIRGLLLWSKKTLSTCARRLTSISLTLVRLRSRLENPSLTVL